jgi:hypothetical protein
MPREMVEGVLGQVALPLDSEHDLDVGVVLRRADGACHPVEEAVA